MAGSGVAAAAAPAAARAPKCLRVYVYMEII